MPNDYLNKLFGMQGQTCVVIGGTGVLGGALCDGVAQAGATVVVAGSSAERGLARVKQIESLGGKAVFLPVDVSSRASIENLLNAAISQLGRIEMLINC